MRFCDNLQHLRTTHNMTQEQLAMRLGVSRQAVSKWESVHAYPEMDKLLMICTLFDCQLDDLVRGDLTRHHINKAIRIPQGQIPQDITDYDKAMRTYAFRSVTQNIIYAHCHTVYSNCVVNSCFKCNF